ncbi:MAG: YlxR family protein [Actinomycetes bacterium]
MSATKPVRTCVGCRKQEIKTELVRLVAVNGACVIDSEARLPGRGAYLHPDSGCLEAALKKKALPRAFRFVGPAALDVQCVREYVGRITGTLFESDGRATGQSEDHNV